jgi:hypothetical protein
MLPLWLKSGRPIVSHPLNCVRYDSRADPKTIPISRNRNITIPVLFPLLSFLLLGWYLLFHPACGPNARFTPYAEYQFTHSKFRIPSSKIMAPGDRNPLRKPDYLPDPIAPKKSGMVVPNAVHYVYGLKPVNDGGEAEELPYYAYLAMRSALVNIRPEKIYL